VVHPDDIRQHFPHPTPRPNQLEWICSIINAFNGGAKNVVVEAPTGSGKTPAIVTVARYFTSKYEQAIHDAIRIEGMSTLNDIERNKRIEAEINENQAYIVTSMKLLQDQYLKESETISIVKGRSNYRCNSKQSMGMSCEEQLHTFGSICKTSSNAHQCEYVKSREQGRLARMSLFNFDSFVNQISLSDGGLKRAIISIDEAHNTDEKLINSMRFSLSETLIESVSSLINRHVDFNVKLISSATPESIMSLTKIAEDINLAIANIETLHSRMRKGSSSGVIAASSDSILIGKSKDKLSRIHRSICRYLVSHQFPWSIQSTKESVDFEPVISRPFAKSALLGYGERRLLTSATVFDGGRRIMSALGLKRDETEYIEVPSTFHARNRRLVPTNAANMSHETFRSNLPKAINAIERIMEKHEGEAGVIHCNSYDMAKRISDNIKSDRLVFHDKGNKGDVVKRFMSRERHDLVLVGVYIKEGYDFRDDIARFQIITRIPYPYPTERIRMRMEIEPGYSEWLAAIDLVQMCGRGVRSESDRCVNYCIDSRLDRFMKRNRSMLPSWFTDSVY